MSKANHNYNKKAGLLTQLQRGAKCSLDSTP